MFYVFSVAFWAFFNNAYFDSHYSLSREYPALYISYALTVWRALIFLLVILSPRFLGGVCAFLLGGICVVGFYLFLIVLLVHLGFFCHITCSKVDSELYFDSNFSSSPELDIGWWILTEHLKKSWIQSSWSFCCAIFFRVPEQPLLKVSSF